ncbi:MAG: DMT family transporter [Acidobacteria bacterium]|nr:DMT family transporter [Acidobacteriota bacterium]
MTDDVPVWLRGRTHRERQGERTLPWMLLLVLLYAVCYALIKPGLAFAPPLGFAGARALIGGVALLAWATVRGKGVLPRPGGWGDVALLAIPGTTVAFAAMFLAASRTGTGVAWVLGNMQPLVAVGLAAVFLGERLTFAKIAALALGVAGVVLLALPSLGGFTAGDATGPALALAVSLGSGVSTVLVKKRAIGFDLLAITAWQLIAGAIPLLSASAAFEAATPIRWTFEFSLLLLFLALAGTALATAVWFRLVRREEVGRLSMFFFLVPLFGVGIGTLVLRESFGLPQLAGGVLIVAAVGAAASNQR